jgi:hypothetical protein
MVYRYLQIPPQAQVTEPTIRAIDLGKLTVPPVPIPTNPATQAQVTGLQFPAQIQVTGLTIPAMSPSNRTHLQFPTQTRVTVPTISSVIVPVSQILPQTRVTSVNRTYNSRHKPR